MSHKVLINGTTYAVAGGDTLVSGTKYNDATITTVE